MAEQQRARDKAIELIHKMQEQTVGKGCTPSEAAGFAAKVAEWIEKYQISEAELASKDGAPTVPEVKVRQYRLRTGKKVFNPGMTAVVNGLAVGMCCKTLLAHESDEAVYLIMGDQLDADYVQQIASIIVPALQAMARLEGAEHGHEKAGLVRWGNQYLTGAGDEIRRRLERERKERSDIKEVEAKVEAATTGTAMVPVTGETIATHKRAVVEKEVNTMYPHTKTTYSKSQYDSTARDRGRAAGRRIGLNIPLKGEE